MEPDGNLRIFASPKETLKDNDLGHLSDQVRNITAIWSITLHILTWVIQCHLDQYHHTTTSNSQSQSAQRLQKLGFTYDDDKDINIAFSISICNDGSGRKEIQHSRYRKYEDQNRYHDQVMLTLLTFAKSMAQIISRDEGFFNDIEIVVIARTRVRRWQGHTYKVNFIIGAYLSQG